MTSLAKHKERWFYLLILPWLIGFVLFQAGPMVGVFATSLLEWKLPQAPSFVGLTHFESLRHDSLAGQALLNTLYYALGATALGLALGLALALLLRHTNRWTVALRTMVFLPVVVSGVALLVVWSWVFNPRYGLINRSLAWIGVEGPAWLFDPAWAMPALILISLWGVGVNMMIYLAALQSIPRELEEAAQIDGAGRVQRLWSITLPLLSPATFYLLVVNLIAALQLFTPSYLLTKGGPENATLTLALYVYLNAFTWAKLGYGSSVALLLLLLSLLLTGAQFRLAPRWVFYLGGK